MVRTSSPARFSSEQYPASADTCSGRHACRHSPNLLSSGDFPAVQANARCEVRGRDPRYLASPERGALAPAKLHDAALQFEGRPAPNVLPSGGPRSWFAPPSCNIAAACIRMTNWWLTHCSIEGDTAEALLPTSCEIAIALGRSG